MGEGVLDETSRKILRLLQSEPELTVAEIGEREPLRFAMRRADDALYAAKNAGRDCVREAEPPAVVLEVVKRAN